MILYNDSRHLFRWGGAAAGLALAAVGLRVWLEPEGSDSVSAGSPLGLAYGLLGGALILFCWLLSTLRYVPTWWFIGSRTLWLKGHIWLGALSFILILCHSGMRLGGLFEQILYLTLFLVLVTGVFGVVLQQFLPRWLTVEVPSEVPYEQIPHVCAALREKADLEVDAKCSCPAPATCQRIQRWYDDIMRPFLGWPMGNHLLIDVGKTQKIFAEMHALPGARHATSKVPDLLNRLETYCNERRLLARQESYHRLLHGWLYLHVPLSAALIVMMFAHAVMALYY